MSKYFPILVWGRAYTKQALSNDLIAAIIVTIMLIPQSLAYALLAGLPAQVGIYASIVPIILYSLIGTSNALAVGPVAVVSLLTASAIGQIVEPGTHAYATAALTLAFLSGGILLLMGIFKLGFMANFLSHPVIAGFISATGLLIASSQIKHILGIDANGHTMPQILKSLYNNFEEANLQTALIGLLAIVFLFWVRKGLNPLLNKMGVSHSLANFITKAGPVGAVILSIIYVGYFELNKTGVSIVGVVPQSLPPITMPTFSPSLIKELIMPALLISVIGFVESVSVAQTLAAKKRQRIDPNQELLGLGAANLGASFTGGYPVTGGFARSVVNYDAGAQTPAAGAFTAVGLAIAAVALTPLIYFLPKATLAATIIVAVLSLVDFSILKRTWNYSKTDFTAVATTIVLTLAFGVEVGVASGVILSILLHLYKTSRPHIAEVGLVPGTQHFRNIDRHEVETCSTILTLRVDESLYFANARYLEDLIQDRVVDGCSIEHVILMFSAVNEVDYSALESLEEISRRLDDIGVKLHLSEVKGPVMDKIESSHFLKYLTGKVYLSQYHAWTEINGNMSKFKNRN